jgi:hypothetical protein
VYICVVESGGGKPQNFDSASGKPLNNEQQQSSSASSDIQIIGASSGSHQQPQQMKEMVSVRQTLGSPPPAGAGSR